MTEIAMPEPARPAEPSKPKSGTPWRDNIEAMLMAIIMAIVLKYFIVEAYRIPTGSMQPTLMGNDATGIYDRILVDKFSYQFKDPERFDVAVFRYPLDRSKNYVKRIVGIGPEHFRVHNGDLWRRDTEDQPWELIRRPASVVDETWLKLAKDDATRGMFYDGARPGWSTGRDFTVEGAARLRFGEDKNSIVDTYNDGYPDAFKEQISAIKRGSGSHPVGDLRIAGTLSVSADTSWVAFELREGALAYDFRLPGPAAPEGAAPEVRQRDLTEVVGTQSHQPTEFTEVGEPMRLAADTAYAFGAENLDDLLTLELDGEVVAQAPVASNPNQASALAIEVTRGTVAFEDVMVYRDIYYTRDHALVGEVFIPAGQYFMMGDNTLDSADSRMWQEHRLERLGEDGEVELLVGNHRGGGRRSQSDFRNDFNPLVSPMSNPAGPPLTWFRDEWGQLHSFLPGEFREADPLTVPAPFVPRDHILGRAIAVFWPIRPFDGVWRLKMVD